MHQHAVKPVHPLVIMAAASGSSVVCGESLLQGRMMRLARQKDLAHGARAPELGRTQTERESKKLWHKPHCGINTATMSCSPNASPAFCSQRRGSARTGRVFAGRAAHWNLYNARGADVSKDVQLLMRTSEPASCHCRPGDKKPARLKQYSRCPLSHGLRHRYSKTWAPEA